MLVYLQRESERIIGVIQNTAEGSGSSEYLNLMLMEVTGMMVAVMVRKNVEFMLFDPSLGQSIYRSIITHSLPSILFTTNVNMSLNANSSNNISSSLNEFQNMLCSIQVSPFPQSLFSLLI